MKTVVPDYYQSFHCIAGACQHTCCMGWEVDVDEESLARYRTMADIASQIEETDGAPHFRLSADERCPFLNEDHLCELILHHGEDILCQICRDHPRFRNFWTDRTEIGLGLVCEEAGRLILSQEKPMKLITLSEDGASDNVPEDEAWLLTYRDELLQSIEETGPEARLLEYLIYRHLPDALYDGRLDARLSFIRRSFHEITEAWKKTDGSMAAMAECARAWSYDVEYDDEELERQLTECDR